MKYIILSLFLFFIASCTKAASSDLPECIVELLEDEIASAAIKTVRKQKKGGEVYYWLNTDGRHIDGMELLVNSSCQTLCVFCGECLQPECAVDQTEEDWEVIWEK